MDFNFSSTYKLDKNGLPNGMYNKEGEVVNLYIGEICQSVVNSGAYYVKVHLPSKEMNEKLRRENFGRAIHNDCNINVIVDPKEIPKGGSIDRVYFVNGFSTDDMAWKPGDEPHIKPLHTRDVTQDWINMNVNLKSADGSDLKLADNFEVDMQGILFSDQTTLIATANGESCKIRVSGDSPAPFCPQNPMLRTEPFFLRDVDIPEAPEDMDSRFSLDD